MNSLDIECVFNAVDYSEVVRCLEEGKNSKPKKLPYIVQLKTCQIFPLIQWCMPMTRTSSNSSKFACNLVFELRDLLKNDFYNFYIAK